MVTFQQILIVLMRLMRLGIRFPGEGKWGRILLLGMGFYSIVCQPKEERLGGCIYFRFHRSVLKFRKVAVEVTLSMLCT